jgi:quercetin dioxygenase-like cupin family protein
MVASQAAFAVIVAAGIAALAVAASATPGAGVTPVVVARGAFADRVNLRLEIKDHRRGHDTIHVRNAADTVMQQIEFAPNAISGWHSHPDPAIIVIKSGQLTFYSEEDRKCTGRTLSAGQAFIEPPGLVHFARNPSATQITEVGVTYFDVSPDSPSPRIDDALPATTPQSIRTLLRRCLEKDPRRRLDSAAVARLEIEEASAPQTTERSAPDDSSRGPRSPVRALVAVGAIAAAAGAVITWSMTRPVMAPAPHVSRFAITLPPAQPLAFSINDRNLAISADGTRLAYTAGGEAQLMVRALDQLDAAPLAGIANARAPFFSPDGRWIGFFERLDEGLKIGPVAQRGTLKKVSTTGGPPITLATLTGASRGASWNLDDSIVFATSDPATGLLRVPAGGGEPEVLTKPDAERGEEDHCFPSVLPGGRGVLFTVKGENREEGRQVSVLDLKTSTGGRLHHRQLHDTLAAETRSVAARFH